MSNPDSDDIPTEALVAIQAGRKVEAIRILREQSGMGLIEARRLVNEVEKDNAPEMPRLAAGREDSGVLRLVAALVILGALAAAALFL